jgi:two-component system, NarL family, sensor kinase
VAEHDALDRLIAAEQDERRRLALFLHDGPVQQLAGIALMLDATAHLIANDRTDEAMGILATALERHRETIRELRDLSFALEPVVLRDQGFSPALQALADQVGTTHSLRVDLDLAAADDIGMTAQIALYTIIRELLDQSIRRGPLSRISVRLSRKPDGSLLTVVTDDAEPERRRRSFDVIEERVHQIRGEIELVASDAGTEVHVTMPAFAAQR